MSTPQMSQRAELEKQRLTRQAEQPIKRGLTPLKIYLLSYNVVSALLWANLLYITISFLISRPASTKTTSYLARLVSSTPLARYLPPLGSHALSGSYKYKNLGWLTKYTQTLAVLEIVHAALGWVRSPLFTTASQVFSRVYTVWGVVEAVPKTQSSPLFATMLLAWSLTEVIRYTYYATSLLGIKIRALDWLRYTTFLPLYPLGAASEAFISFSTLPPLSKLIPDWLVAKIPVRYIFANLPPPVKSLVIKSGWGRALLWGMAKSGVKAKAGISGEWGMVDFGRLILFVGWWPALYVLYTYMLKQRKRVLGAGKSLGATKKRN